ncbi:fungal-specific transcription factor domain-containing protein [Hypoxylon fragiforme]|uniref:fungal-specific transcription factor domain-containing protein n=1 Tax=Hypoxylon fragiforme TaxID=63214 RepID=UPI0020C71329|nr:fungal-specific transcription factor domain-containing protein [Hypoxylon fragiforme]KAI2609866.1 fungal-specific transcription factor domain-containing protein [Hypoxylon fragiforme]
MGGNHPPQRKACDLCYRRKIKCDGQQPRCTTCVLHNKSECTYNAASRKTPSRKQAEAQRLRRECDLQSRVQVLERQLSTVLEKVEKLERKQDSPSASTAVDGNEDASKVMCSGSGLPDLPPFEEVLPIVERYLATFNSVFPLFHAATLLQTVKSWYLNPHTRNVITWALINVVLALAHHTSDPGDWDQRGNAAAIYLNNVQSVLTEIVIRDTSLVNVQIILGLVILFWTAEDLRPALILIGTALRLAHGLGLHTRKSSQQCSPALALQKSRVFWMAYILDRDVSLVSRVAPVQLDSDIDLDLPPSEAEGDEDLVGFIFAADRHTKLNYFRARVELARIQGTIYQCVYSTSAQNQSSEQRASNAARIARLLEDWNARIPPAFYITALSSPSSPSVNHTCSELSRRRYLCILYSTTLTCRALISFANAADSFHYSEWMQRLQDYGGEVAAGQMASSHAPVPQGWQALADASREYMRLFETVKHRDTFFLRITLCAHNSSLISLMANRIFNAHDRATESDKHIIETAMHNLEITVRQTESERQRSICDAIKRLCSCADLISFQNLTLGKTSPRRISLPGSGRDSSGRSLEEGQYLQDDVTMPGGGSYWD